MKTIEQIKEYKPQTIDGRDMNRLVSFLPEDVLNDMGIVLQDEFKGKHVPHELTKENIMEFLKADVDFGFEKALDCRGISASCMYAVVNMWNWILEEGLEDFAESNYAFYGLPLFKATAIKYSFDNPIGDDTGTEVKYDD